MGFQPEYGMRLIREKFAEGAIPYYRFIKEGTDETQVKLCTEDERPIAVTLCAEEWGMPDGAGGMVKRTGFADKEIPEAQMTGITFIELGDKVVQGLAKSDSTGRAVQATVSATALGAELEAIGGYILEGGEVGDIVRIDLDRRQ